MNMLVTENLEQFVLNLPKTELLDSTLFISIYDFVKFNIEKCMKIGEKLYEDIEDDPEDKKLILRYHSSISKKVESLKKLNFWNRLSNLNFYLMDKEDTTLMEFEGLFFVKDKKKPILYGTDTSEEEFSISTFEFKVENEEKEKKFTKYTRKIESNFEQDILQRQLFNFIKSKWDVYDNDRANNFLGVDSFLVHETKYQEVLEWNCEFLRNLSLQDLQFLTKLKTQIEKRHLYMNHVKHAYAPWDASGFIFDQDGVLVIFHER